MRAFIHGNGHRKTRFRLSDDSVRCLHESEKSRIREGLRSKIYSRTLILPRISKNPEKESPIDMSRVPLIFPERNTTDQDPENLVTLEVGLPGDTWRYCVEKQRLVERSEWFRAMLMGSFAPPAGNPVKLEYVEKRAFDCFLKYLHDEPIHFQSVSTARATLDAAHQYLCPELARLAVKFLEANLNSHTVLEIYQGLRLYANDPISGVTRSTTTPSAPPNPGDEAGEIAAYCTRLLVGCFSVIDEDPETVFRQERFEELSLEEVVELARRDTLRLQEEGVLFTALDRWAASECRRRGLEPTPGNKRNVLVDDVWYSVRFLLMTDKEFVNGPMASGILSSEESAFIVSRILGHKRSRDADELRVSGAHPLARLSSAPRICLKSCEGQGCRISKAGKKEREDNRKNRRKECATQGQRACARIGNCLVRVLACVFD